jgi:hypothetical protein
MIERARLAHWRAVAVWGIWVAALALALLGLVEVLPSGLANATNVAVALALILSTVTVGAALVTRLPRHIVGWLLLESTARWQALSIPISSKPRPSAWGAISAR